MKDLSKGIASFALCGAVGFGFYFHHPVASVIFGIAGLVLIWNR